MACDAEVVFDCLQRNEFLSPADTKFDKLSFQMLKNKISISQGGEVLC